VDSVDKQPQTAPSFTAIPIMPTGFQAREIGEGDWFDVPMDDLDQIMHYILSVQYDYRWVWE
jgi:hypothetical protein